MSSTGSSGGVNSGAGNANPVGGGTGGSNAAGSFGVGGTKKKFGKNLNKLNKPPAPTAATSSGSGASGGVGGGSGVGSSSTFRGSSSSRNGLLFLSTKSKSSVGGSSSGGGLLSSTSSTSSSLRDLTKSGGRKSAHDALLLSASFGGNDDVGTGSAGQSTSAWGVGEKQPSAGEANSSASTANSVSSPSSFLQSEKNHEIQQEGQHRIAKQLSELDTSQKSGRDDQAKDNGQKPSLVLAPRGSLKRGSSASQHQSLNSSIPTSAQQSVSPTSRSAAIAGGSTASLNSKASFDDIGKETLIDSVNAGKDDSGVIAGVKESSSPLDMPTQHEKQVHAIAEEPHAIDKSTPSQSSIQSSSDKPNESRNDEQVQFMSKLAKERAEKRRSEEESRMAQQKERAAMRLRELEEKKKRELEKKQKELEKKRQDQIERQQKQQLEMQRQQHEKVERNQKVAQRNSTSDSNAPLSVSSAGNKTPPKSSPHPKNSTRSQSRRDIPKTIAMGQPSSQIVLEPLGKPKKIMSKPAKNASKSADSNLGGNDAKNSAKSLYDPNRTFSSLVGGKAKNVGGNSNDNNSGIKMRGGDARSVGTPPPRDKKDKSEKQLPPGSPKGKDENPPIQMIQLNREDRDRGGRGTGGGPRMLFDPKSGSMVAVSSREESSLGTKNVKKTKPKSRKELDFEAIQKSPPPKQHDVSKILIRRPEDGATNDGSRKQKGRKDDAALQRKGNKRFENEADGSDRRGRHPSNSPPKLKQPVKKRLPRTCGVQYKMDQSNNYVNVDGCDSDVGYGAHSVPGGRLHNPAAYAKLLAEFEEQQQYEGQQNLFNGKQSNFLSEAYAGEYTFNDRVRNDPSFLKHQTDFEEKQQRLLEEAWSSLLDEEPKRAEPDVEEDSSTVSERAPTWAPIDSDFAESSIRRFSTSKSDGDIKDEYAAALAIDPSMIGLGFHSTETADPLMGAGSSKDEPMDLAKFALEAATVGTSKSTSLFGPLNVSGSRFLGSSTWGAGTTDSNTSVDDIATAKWDFPGTNGTNVSDGVNGSIAGTSKLFSFPPLSTNHENTWGSSAFDGLNFGKTDSSHGTD